jgi:hypothetical protein
MGFLGTGILLHRTTVVKNLHNPHHRIMKGRLLHLVLAAFVPPATLIMKRLGGWCTQGRLNHVVEALMPSTTTTAMRKTPARMFLSDSRKQHRQQYPSGSLLSRSINLCSQRVLAGKSCKS